MALKLTDVETEPEVLDFINKLAPNHDRTSCSDDNISNALGQLDDGHIIRGRCRRCSLLMLAHRADLGKGVEDLLDYLG